MPTEVFFMNGRDFINKTQTQLIPLVFKEFLPEKDIYNGEVLREDYEKLRIVYELQRDIAPEIEINAVLNRILDRTSEILDYEQAVVLLVNKRRKLEQRAYRNVKGNKARLLSKTLIRHLTRTMLTATLPPPDSAYSSHFGASWKS